MNLSFLFLATKSSCLILTVLCGTSFAFSSSSHRVVRKKSNRVNRPSSVSNTIENNADVRTTDALICGGGPTGLLSAIMLTQKFPDFRIQLYDQQSAPPSPTDDRVWCDVAKYYLIGLGGRGITSLEEFGVWKDVENVAIPVPGRKDYSPGNPDGVERMLTERKYTTQVLPRDKLISVLHQHIVENYADRIDLNYGYQVRPVDLAGSSRVQVEIAECGAASWQRISASLVIASDGSARTFANHMEEEDARMGVEDPFSVVRYEDDNQRVYKIIPFQLPSDWKHDLDYSFQGDRLVFDALPANDRGGYVGVLLMRRNDEMAQANVDPNAFSDFLNQFIPQFSSLLDDETIANVAKSAPSFLPAFRYVKPRLHQGKRTVLLGDCAHTVKPYFGMGANSALEDVKILGECLDDTHRDLEKAILQFSTQRAPEIATLVRVSHSLDRPGLAGIFSFLIPIILDGIFQKLAPQVFAPNVIAMIQSEDITFQQAAQRKRLDRVGQLAILGGSLLALVKGSQLVWELLFG